MTDDKPLVEAPKSTARAEITPLGYMASRDAIAKADYAYAVYKETNPSTGKWTLKIKPKMGAGTTLDPDHPSVRKHIAEAAVKGETYTVFGYHLKPKDGDARRVETQIHFDEDYQPTRVTCHLVTRQADGSPTEEQQLEIPWPGPSQDPGQLISPAKSTDRREVTQLAYLNSWDVITNKDYAYVIAKERQTDSGKWVLKISGKSTAGSTLDPEHASFKKSLAAAVDGGEGSMQFGYEFKGSEGDARKVESRLHFDGDGNPQSVELRVITRRADGSPWPEQVAKVDWPASSHTVS